MSRPLAMKLTLPGQCVGRDGIGCRIARLRVGTRRRFISKGVSGRQFGSQPQGAPCWQPQPQAGAAAMAVWQPQSQPAPTQGLQVQVVVSVFMEVPPGNGGPVLACATKFPYSPAVGLEYWG